MTRIEKKFEELRQNQQKALVAFITAGDPDLHFTVHAIQALEKGGADIVELGMPFSDPMADGPTIQKSSERALKAKTTLKGILKTVSKVREHSEIPILLMGYSNPVFQFGLDAFCHSAKKAGVDALLLVDLPPEEATEFVQTCQKHELNSVFLLAPTSDSSRIQSVTQSATGFIYYVSLTGITGASLSISLTQQKALKEARRKAKIPICVGFGIKTPEQAREVAQYADGVVVGSALVDLFEHYQGDALKKKILDFTLKLSRAVHR